LIISGGKLVLDLRIAQRQAQRIRIGFDWHSGEYDPYDSQAYFMFHLANNSDRVVTVAEIGFIIKHRLPFMRSSINYWKILPNESRPDPIITDPGKHEDIKMPYSRIAVSSVIAFAGNDVCDVQVYASDVSGNIYRSTVSNDVKHILKSMPLLGSSVKEQI